MLYEYSLIHISDKIGECADMYSLCLINARAMELTLDGKDFMLSGKFLLCLSTEDKTGGVKGEFYAKCIYFLPYFYNVNLNTAVIDAPFYSEMREQYGYPDFYLFRVRDERYNGIIKLNDEEYENLFSLFLSAEKNIGTHSKAVMWSCRARSDMISILRVAESARTGTHAYVTNEILRYIRANPAADLSVSVLCRKFCTNRTTLTETVRALTGMPPRQYVLSERLEQSRPELLFTQIPVAEIAEKYGFSDPNYYVRAFKKKYGIPPGRYRSEGFERRITDEKKYRLINGGRDLMTEEEFREYLTSGQGVAVIRLRREPDKARFRQIYKDHVINSRVYGSKAYAYEYEDELLSCFDDAEQIKHEIFSYCMTEKAELSPYLVRYLKRYGFGEPLEKKLKAEYENLYDKVSAAADGIPDKSLYALFGTPCTDDARITEKKLQTAAESVPIYELNEIYSDYHTVLDAYAAFDDTKETEKHLLYNELKMRRKTGYVPSAPAYDVFFSRIYPRINDGDAEIREYVNNILPRDYCSMYGINRIVYMRPSEIEKLDCDYFINTDDEPSRKSAAFCSEYLPPSVRVQTEKQICSITDKKKRNGLFSLFKDAPDDESELDSYLCERFSDELKEEADKDPESPDAQALAAFVLRGVSPKIKKYAAELIDKRLFTAAAVRSYFLYNYEKEERELFAVKLSETNAKDYSIYAKAFVDAISRGTPDLPLEMTYFSFRQQYGAKGAGGFNCREKIINALYRGGVYDERVIEEGLHDANAKVRKTAALMRDKKPYVTIKKLNGENVADCVKFYEEYEKRTSQFAVGLDRHLTKDEASTLLYEPIKNNVFCDTNYLSVSVRVKLLSERRINGYIAYTDKKPVGFIDCGDGRDYTFLTVPADAPDSDEFVITAPTATDGHAAEALIQRVIEYTEDDRRAAKAYLQRNREDGDFEKTKELFLSAGFKIHKQNEDGAILIKKGYCMTYDEFEKIIIGDIISQYPQYSEKLTRQFESSAVVRRNISANGFFTEYEINDKTASLGDGVKLQLGENQWNINGLEHGSDYILWIKNGFISSLEGFSYGEPWPDVITEISKIAKE